MKRTILAVLGFLLMGMGALALILGSMGLSLSPIAFLDRMMSPMGSIVVKLVMMLTGFILFYFGRLDPEMD
ncbi:MAG: hypothetical protein ACI9FN_003028 [Saprospiraceae bacterium]|jgi:hypothetical protein